MFVNELPYSKVQLREHVVRILNFVASRDSEPNIYCALQVY